METLGTVYGGWDIPVNADLNNNSIVYSGGVGEDISFDLNLSDKYNCKIVLIDPTHRAISHYNNVKTYYDAVHQGNTYTFQENIQPDYIKNISSLSPNFNNFTYLDCGLHDKKGTLKFYKQRNSSYVSQTLIRGMYGDTYDTIEVDTITNIMAKLGHTKIDLLKLDIEGSEIDVLNRMIKDKIFPKYLCIEFDLLLKGKDSTGLTQKLVNKLLQCGYKILINKNLNITFEYT